jgi:dTMP kinase
MFITFEGIDLSGKSTQIKLLSEYLKDKGFEVISLREPGGTKISELIRNILLDKNSKGMHPMTEFLLYSASRSQLVAEVIKPALESGKTVICDRYYDSSTAYQGFGRELGVGNINLINEISTGGLKSDLTIFLDISVAESLRRLKQINKLTDRIESESVNFFNRVRQGFLAIATKEPDRFKVINGEDDINTVRRRIIEVIVDKFNLK